MFNQLHTKPLIFVGVLIYLFCSTLAQAALFDDTEARKKILEVEVDMKSQNKTLTSSQLELKKAQQSLEQRLVAIEAILKGPGLADMQNQLDSFKQDVARLKGELDLMNHRVEVTQRQQKDLYADLDARLRKIELYGDVESRLRDTDAKLYQMDTRLSKLEANLTTTAVPFQATPASSQDTNSRPPQGGLVTPPTRVVEAATVQNRNSREYQLLELANGLLKEAKYKDAFATFDKFLREYPTSAFVADAIYGLGYSQFALKNYRSAITTQQKLLDAYPDSPKAPDALLNMSYSQIQLGLTADAKKSLQTLMLRFPNSELVPTAQKRLKALEAIKTG